MSVLTKLLNEHTKIFLLHSFINNYVFLSRRFAFIILRYYSLIIIQDLKLWSMNCSSTLYFSLPLYSIFIRIVHTLFYQLIPITSSYILFLKINFTSILMSPLILFPTFIFVALAHSYWISICEKSAPPDTSLHIKLI